MFGGECWGGEIRVGNERSLRFGRDDERTTLGATDDAAGGAAEAGAHEGIGGALVGFGDPHQCQAGGVHAAFADFDRPAQEGAAGGEEYDDLVVASGEIEIGDIVGGEIAQREIIDLPTGTFSTSAPFQKVQPAAGSPSTAGGSTVPLGWRTRAMSRSRAGPERGRSSSTPVVITDSVRWAGKRAL